MYFCDTYVNGKAKPFTIEYFNTISKNIELLNLKEYKEHHTPDMDEIINRKIVWL